MNGTDATADYSMGYPVIIRPACDHVIEKPGARHLRYDLSELRRGAGHDKRAARRRNG